MNPVNLTVWVLARNVPAVVLTLLALTLCVLTAALIEHRRLP